MAGVSGAAMPAPDPHDTAPRAWTPRDDIEARRRALALEERTAAYRWHHAAARTLDALARVLAVTARRLRR